MVNSQIKLLIVDDEPDILEFLKYNLEREDYQVFTATTGKEAIEVAVKVEPHLILLDIMMPEMDGIEACKELRSKDKFRNTIIAFLTARNEDYSQVAGFDVGADDYITKPIKPRVLMSRIKALLRRFSEDAPGEKILAGDLIIDREQYVVRKNNEEINLPKKEFELLALLASKPGKVFTRDEILSRIWGKEIIVGDRTIDVHIRKLREKLGEDYLKTVKGIGYKFDH